MTKKLICFLLAAFLGVSLIALLAACRSGADSQTPSQSTYLAAEVSDSAAPGTSEPDTTDVFSLEVPTEQVEE